MHIDKMNSFNVLLILAISAITTAYPVVNPYYEFIHPSNPYSNYPVLVNRPYQAPNTFSIEQPESHLLSYDDSRVTSFEQLPAPQRPKSQTSSHQKDEIHKVIEDILKLLIDQHLCDISISNNGRIRKRSADQYLTARAAPTLEPGSFTQQQLAFLKDLKPEDIKELIKLLIPATPALVANRTLPIQELPHSEPAFYLPTPLWQPAPQMLPPSPYIQNLMPFHPFQHQQIMSYDPLHPEEVHFQIIKPYVESPETQPIRLPPVSSPFVYSLQISAPLHSNQPAAKPLPVPTSQVELKPTPKPSKGVTNPKEFVYKLLESIHSQETSVPNKKPTQGQISTDNTHEDLRTLPTNKEEHVSNEPVEKLNSTEGDAGTAKSAETSGEFLAQFEKNEHLLEIFKAIRENLIRNNPCTATTPKRRAINERADSDFNRKQMYQNYLNRHAIPPAALPRRHNPPTKITFHKYSPHTPLHTRNWY